MKKFLRVLPWALTGLVAVGILSTIRTKPEPQFHIREFGQLPVLLNGRIQPLNSVAENSLLQIRRKRNVMLEGQHPSEMNATEWLLEVLMKPEVANDRKIFRIDHPELLSLLKLPANEKHFSFNQLTPSFQEIDKQAQRLTAVDKNDHLLIDEKTRTPFEKRLLEVYHALSLFNRLKSSLKPEASDDFAAELKAYQEAIKPGIEAVQAERAGQKYDKQAFDQIIDYLSHYDFVAKVAYPLLVPPLQPEKSRDAWENMGTSLMESMRSGQVHPAAMQYASMCTAYRQDKPAEFNRAVDDYRQWLSQKFAPEMSKGSRESFYNHFQAFYKALGIYVFAFILGGISLLAYGLWPNVSEVLRRTAYSLIGLAFVVHTFGLIFRMVLEGRPPVTNLYSSAIFIGWGAVVLGLVLERVYHVGLGNAVASLAGFATLVIAHNLALGGDTMEMLRAVLDTNFWLATHVVVVTLGYASTFVAGLLAIHYIFLGLLTPILSQKLGQRKATAINAETGSGSGPQTGIPAAAKSPAEVGKTEVGKALAKMVYGIICFATLFSFVGTVLGGIWADQSWGRFWGWDPKENGALIIVLWNALILHIRWGGMVKERGLINLAVFGNVVTSFSWFGVNMLGIGLHSYGFMDAAFWWLLVFVASQIVIIGLGLIPLRFWRSFRKPPAESGAPHSAPLPPEAGNQQAASALQ